MVGRTGRIGRIGRIGRTVRIRGRSGSVDRRHEARPGVGREEERGPVRGLAVAHGQQSGRGPAAGRAVSTQLFAPVL